MSSFKIARTCEMAKNYGSQNYWKRKLYFDVCSTITVNVYMCALCVHLHFYVYGR